MGGSAVTVNPMMLIRSPIMGMVSRRHQRTDWKGLPGDAKASGRPKIQWMKNFYFTHPDKAALTVVPAIVVSPLSTLAVTS
jgi:hypothetical protein